MPGYADAPLPLARPQAPYPLRPYRPSGLPQAPVVLIEGPAYSGKNWLAVTATADERICQTWWIDWGGKSAIEEYGSIPGADFQIVPHDGTFWSVLSLVEQISIAARDVVSRDGAPMLVISGGASEWQSLLWLGHRWTMASPSVQRRIENNPAARADNHQIPQNTWSDLHALHEQFMRPLRVFPGIVVITTKGREVAAYDEDGNLVPGERTYKVSGHRDLPYDATAWVRTSTTGAPVIVGAKSAHSPVRPGQDQPREFTTLPELVFDVLGYQPRPWEPDLRMEELRQAAAGEPRPADVDWDARLAEADQIDDPAKRKTALDGVWRAARFAAVRFPGTVPDGLIGRIEKAGHAAAEQIRLGDNPGTHGDKTGTEHGTEPGTNQLDPIAEGEVAQVDGLPTDGDSPEDVEDSSPDETVPEGTQHEREMAEQHGGQA